MQVGAAGGGNNLEAEVNPGAYPDEVNLKKQDVQLNDQHKTVSGESAPMATREQLQLPEDLPPCLYLHSVCIPAVPHVKQLILNGCVGGSCTLRGTDH